MRVELGMQRGNKNKDPKLALVRRATTTANTKYGIGGRVKTRGGVKKITLPRLKCLEVDNE
jgi:hypothetical protein